MSRKTVVRLGLIGASLASFWALWVNDAAINAFILFCTAGIVPGTNTELTPEQVYIVLGAILFVAFVGIFWKQWRRLASAIIHIGKRAPAAEVSVNEPVASVEAVTPVVQEQAAATPAAEPIVITVPAQPNAIQLAWRRVRPYLIMAVGAALERSILAIQSAGTASYKASLWIYGYMMRGWLWVEPYLRRFDRWLEQTLKSNKDIAAGMHLWREVVRTTTVRFHDLRSRVQRFTRAPED